MTVETTDSRVQYATNGTTGPWTVSFYFLADSDLQVIYTDADGVETILAASAYTVTGAGVPSGGTVTTDEAYASGGLITISNEVEALQETDYTDTDSFPAETHERALDRITMLAQRGLRLAGRSLVKPASDETDMALPGAADRALRVLGFDSDGAPVMLTRTDDGGSALALDLIDASSSTKGPALVGLDQSLNYAVGTLGWFCRESAILATAPIVGVSDGAVGDYNGTTGTDDTTALNAAITYAASVGKVCYIPGRAYGNGYLVTSTLLLPVRSQVAGDHKHMGYQGGTTIWFKPSAQDNFLEPTGSPSTGKDGYLVTGLHVIGNSASSTGNSDIGLNVDNIIKSTFSNLRIQGFRTGIRCYATNSNTFQAVHSTDNYVQSVLYAGGNATTDNWWGGYVSNAPILVQTTGANICIRFTGTVFEGAGWPKTSTDTDEATGINIVKECYGWQLIGCYGEDAPLTNQATNAMVRVGRDGSALAGAPQIAIIGGMWGGRNAGGVGAFLDVDYTDGVTIGGGAYITRFTNGIKTSSNTPTNAVVSTGWTCTSMSTQVTDDTKVTGLYPIGVSSSGTHNQQTYRLAGDQVPGSSTACTGAITTAAAWKLTKDGIVVTLTLPSVSGTATAAPSFTFGEALPSKYRPSASLAFLCPIKNNGADQSTPGLIVIDYLTGNITVYKDATRTANFTNAASAGLTDGTVISWAV